MKCLQGNFGISLNQPPCGSSVLALSSASANQPPYSVTVLSSSQLSAPTPAPLLSTNQSANLFRWVGLLMQHKYPKHPKQVSQASPSSASQPPLLSSPLSPTFPWNTIFSHPILTLHHVPKGARDYGEELVYDIFTALMKIQPLKTHG